MKINVKDFVYNDNEIENGIKEALKSEKNSANVYDPFASIKKDDELINALNKFHQKEKENLGLL